MKFGVFTVCTPEYDIPETATILKELGYDGVEWRVADPAPAEKPDNFCDEQRYWSYNISTIDLHTIYQRAPEVKKLCAESGLEIYSLTTYLGVSDIPDIERVLQAAQLMSCPNIRVNVPKYDGSEPYPLLFDRTVRQAAVIAEMASRYQVRVNFEIHMGNIIPSASAAFRFVSGFNPAHIGIIFDPGNMVHEGFENYRLGLELLGEYLACVHIKNAVWKLEPETDHETEIWKPAWSPLTKGYADIPALVHILRDMNYQGYLSVEDFSNEDDTYTKLQRNLVYLKRLYQS